MNIIYKSIEHKVIIENINYISYGILCFEDNVLIDSIYDVSLNKNDVNNICNYLNNNRISPVHFYDIVEDFLAK